MPDEVKGVYRKVSCGHNDEHKVVVIMVDESFTRVTIGFTAEETEKLIDALKQELIKVKTGLIVPEGPVTPEAR
jgi:hypothetical protein